MPTCKFTKKTPSHILLHVFFFVFSECITITSSEEALKVSGHNFLQEIQARIQRSKEVSQTTRFKSFPLQLSGHQDVPPLSFVLRHQL